jgi:hypothetical protein
MKYLEALSMAPLTAIENQQDVAVFRWPEVDGGYEYGALRSVMLVYPGLQPKDILVYFNPQGEMFVRNEEVNV